MAFNVDRFSQTEFVYRIKKVPVPTLAPFFDGDDEALWEIRGLNSDELHGAISASGNKKALETILAAIAETPKQAKQAGSAMGLMHGGTSGEVTKRLEMLVKGSVSPKVDLPMAVKLAEAFPIEFLDITNEITNLTGMGYDYAKPKAVLQKEAS